MPITLAVRLGRRIAAIREEKGLSQTQLADMAEIGRAHLSQIENGAVSARIDTIQALATSLDITLSQLFQNLV